MLSIPTCFFFLTEEINQIRQETEEYDKVSQVTECRFTCFGLRVYTFSGTIFVILSLHTREDAIDAHESSNRLKRTSKFDIFQFPDL